MSLADAMKHTFESDQKTFDRVKQTGMVLFDTVIEALSAIQDYEIAGSKQHKKTLDKVTEILRNAAYKLP